MLVGTHGNDFNATADYSWRKYWRAKKHERRKEKNRNEYNCIIGMRYILVIVMVQVWWNDDDDDDDDDGDFT